MDQMFVKEAERQRVLWGLKQPLLEFYFCQKKTSTNSLRHTSEKDDEIPQNRSRDVDYVDV